MAPQKEKLSRGEQILHFASIGLIGIAIALVMAPAALHRQRGAQEISQDFIRLASQLLRFSMYPLMAAICAEFYLIGRIILNERGLSLLFAVLLLSVLLALWVLLPRMHGLQRVLSRE